MWKAIGAIVMGRHLFDLVNGWEGQPPAGDHVVVGQALLRQHRGPAPARGSPRRHPGRPGAAPAIQGASLDPDRVPERAG
jgi:hypothetical protein